MIVDKSMKQEESLIWKWWGKKIKLCVNLKFWRFNKESVSLIQVFVIFIVKRPLLIYKEYGSINAMLGKCGI